MTESIDGDTSSEVEILTVLGIPETTAFSFHHHWGRSNIRRNHVWGMLAELGGRWGIGWRIGIWDGCLFLAGFQHGFSRFGAGSPERTIMSCSMFWDAVEVGTAIAEARRCEWQMSVGVPLVFNREPT